MTSNLFKAHSLMAILLPFYEVMQQLHNIRTLPIAQSIVNKFFTVTAKIHARSLAKFYGQYADRHMNLTFVRRVSEREREI